MTSTPSDSPAAEKYLQLPDGRTLAYAENGDPTSTDLVIFFHGAFGVGSAPRRQPILDEKKVHFVAPTLPGWGTSTPRNKSIPYHISLASDITHLIEHLHPREQYPKLRIYVFGGSFGTVPAQMLYGASFDNFPYGREIVGCMILGPFSPFKWHKGYTKTMTTPNYIAIGPPSQYVPFRLLPRMAGSFMGGKLQTLEKAETFIREQLFDKMEGEEAAAFKKWKEENNVAEGQLEREFATNMTRSVQNSWEGYLEMADVIHSDWGFQPKNLDDEHNARPILIVSSEGDTMAPDAMAKWLAANYKNNRSRSVSGGHIAALFHMNELWKDMLEI